MLTTMVILTSCSRAKPAQERQKTTRLYRNDAGIFNDSGIALPGFYASAAAWGDVDNDGKYESGALRADDQCYYQRDLS